MRGSIAAGVCAVALFAAGSAGAAGAHGRPAAPLPGTGLSVGVNDDAGKYGDGAPQFWQTMAAEGLKQDAMTVLWDETRPTTILDQSFIEHALPAAATAGIKVVFDVYPMHSRALTSDPAAVGEFASFVGRLAETFPQVTEYVVMNECNQPRFVNPQFASSDPDAPNVSAAICGRALAAAYDALKAVDPDIFVWGLGLSPRGNDRPNASSNVSTSPIRFLADLGAWYRSSGRTAPLMDGLDVHPYPIPQSLPFDRGYADPNAYSVSNLDRVYQAFYDAFANTPQRTIGQQAGGGLPVSLNEVGIQTLTDTIAHPGYAGAEISTPATGVLAQTATEQYQADWYVKMLNLVACDPNVRAVDIFHLVDESDLAGWQSGLFYVGYAPKAAAGALEQWIAQTGGQCSGVPQGWTPTPVTAGAWTPPVPAQAKAARLRQAIALAKKKLARVKTVAAAATLGNHVSTLQKQLARLNAQIRVAHASGQPSSGSTGNPKPAPAPKAKGAAKGSGSSKARGKKG
jgi:hypothetical protein